jgi:hypothetical protein
MLVIKRRVLQLLAVASVLTFWGVFIFLFATTNLCSSCASSQVWRYSVLACIPTYLLALLPLFGQRATRGSFPVFGILTLVLVGAGSLTVGLWFGLTYIFESWAQTYNIVYFSWIAFPFTSGMIPLISVTLGLVSFNVTVAFREPLKSPKHWSFRGCWTRVIRNFLLFLGLVLLIHSYSAQLLSYLPTLTEDMVVFTILMTALMLVPLFSLYSEVERRHRLVKIILGGGVALSVIELIPHLGELIGLMIPGHPFTVIPVFSLFLVCIACAAGEIGVFMSHPLYIPRHGLVKYVVTIAVAIVLLYITWTSTHAAITVLI